MDRLPTSVASKTSDHIQQRNGGARRASLFALAVLIPWAIFIAIALMGWYREAQLGRRALTTTGVITRIESENHQQYDYEYSVGGAEFKGGEIIPGASLGIGETVQVFYIPDAPHRSQLTAFGAAGTRPVPLLLCCIGALISYVKLRRFLLPGRSDVDAARL